MKKILFLILFLKFSTSDALETVHVLLGDDHKIPLTSSRIWIEDSKVLKGEPMGSHLRLQGLKEGSSLVGVGDRKYQFYVIHPKKQNTYKELLPILEKILGLKVKYLKGETVVEGELFRLEDWKTLASQLASQEIDYRLTAQMNPELIEEAQKYFNNLFEKNKLPSQGLIFANGVELRLPPKNTYIESFRKLLSPYGISVQEDTRSLALEPTIRVQITVAEVQKQLTQKIGLRWPDSYQAQILPKSFWNFDSLDAVANFFEQSGHGRVLASPNLICRSGKEAEFLAGGEFPIKVSNFKMQNVVWKKYGILLKVKPQADALGQINLQIETEISSLDPSKAIDGIPGLITHKVSSHFDLRKPQTIVLSGLIKNEESQSSEGLPWVSRIPVLGALFSSKDFRENRTELIIFVRPEVLDLQNTPDAPLTHLKETSI